jgi:PucR-like helix-turn-helix protein
MSQALTTREPVLTDVTRWPDGPVISAALRPAVPHLVDEMIAAIRAEIPAFDRPLRGRFGELVRRTVTESLERFLALLAGEERDARARSDLYVEVGRGELRSGRPLEMLLSAYRTGGRVMWRGFAAAGQEAGLDPAALYRVAEALFAYVDELSAESAEGYADEQSLLAGERERERRLMLEILLRRPPADFVVAQAQAVRAEWLLPDSFAPVATLAAHVPPRHLEHRLPLGSLAANVDGTTVALVPDLDAPGRLAEVERALGGAPATRGPTVPWDGAAEAIDRAILGVQLQQAGILAEEGLAAADDHLLELILHRDPERACALADRALAGLDALSDSSRDRLTETLEAWLANACNTTATANALHVHAQTLRYRLRQLEEVLGSDRLNDHRSRIELELALMTRQARP